MEVTTLIETGITDSLLTNVFTIGKKRIVNPLLVCSQLRLDVIVCTHTEEVSRARIVKRLIFPDGYDYYTTTEPAEPKACSAYHLRMTNGDDIHCLESVID